MKDAASKASQDAREVSQDAGETRRVRRRALVLCGLATAAFSWGALGTALAFHDDDQLPYALVLFIAFGYVVLYGLALARSSWRRGDRGLACIVVPAVLLAVLAAHVGLGSAGNLNHLVCDDGSAERHLTVMGWVAAAPVTIGLFCVLAFGAVHLAAQTREQGCRALRQVIRASLVLVLLSIGTVYYTYKAIDGFMGIPGGRIACEVKGGL